MSEAIPETIDKATRAVEVAAKPNIFPVVIALAALAGVAALVWRNEVRADAQIDVMRAISTELHDMRLSFRDAGIRVTHHDPPPKVQASSLGGEE